MAADQLKAALKEREQGFDEPTRIRLHRSISWLSRAEAEGKDLDARFIFLWIAFNAAYAQEFGAEDREREVLRSFLQKVLAVDADRKLHKLVFEKYSGPVRSLIENKFVFAPFWRALREHDSSEKWKEHFVRSQKDALRSVMGKETSVVLEVVFDRLYVLRNQLVHGGATWNSKVNRAQVKDGAALMQDLVQAIIALMLDHPELKLGNIAYPVV